MKKTALVADDHEVFRVFLGSILKDRLGFDRVEAVDSFDAVVAALERSPRVSLVLLDLSMPGMDGASSLATIRTLRPEAHVAVVSGSLDRGDMMAAMASGVHGYVPKALGIQEMTEALGRIAEGQVYLPPSFAAVPVAGAAAPAPAPASAAPAERRAARAVRPGRVRARRRAPAAAEGHPRPAPRGPDQPRDRRQAGHGGGDGEESPRRAVQEPRRQEQVGGGRRRREGVAVVS
jgi:DNA-binding NarL/FixJ family response regulator